MNTDGQMGPRFVQLGLGGSGRTVRAFVTLNIGFRAAAGLNSDRQAGIIRR